MVGGGITGLSLARFLTRHGLDPVVFESTDQVGGLGRQFSWKGVEIDCFYHVISPPDRPLLDLIRDVGLASEVGFEPVRIGYHIDGRLYPLSKPIDLLRFEPLSFLDRLRTGLGTLYLQRMIRDATSLDRRNVREWLTRIFGPRVYDVLWAPLLASKFGDRADQVPAYWMWARLCRESKSSARALGRLKGGGRRLLERLRETLEAAGHPVRTAAAVRVLSPDRNKVTLITSRGEEIFDAAVSTLPIPQSRDLLEPRLHEHVPFQDLHYQGVVNAVVACRRSLSPYYVLPVKHPDFWFQGVVETTRVIPKEELGGAHWAYLMNYCGRASEAYATPDEVVEQRAIEGLSTIFPGFSRSDVHDVHVFRTPFVEPVWQLGHLSKVEGSRLGDTRVWIANTAFVYPGVNSFSSAVELAERTAARVAAALRGG